MSVIGRYLKYMLVAVFALFFIVIKLFFRLIRKLFDLTGSAYGSVKNSESFAEAYKNFASDEYSKSRLSIPEEVIALMAKVAKSDGVVSKVEVEFMSDTIKSMVSGMQQAGVPKVLLESTKKKLFALANRAKADERSIQYYCQSLSKANEQVRMGVFMQLVTFASVDGLSDKTLALLDEIGQALQFTAEQIKNMQEQVRGGGSSGYPSTINPYEVLGCQESDEFSLIKKRYRKLVKDNHPDFMHGQGMDDAQIQAATEKMQEINAAFEEVKRRQGV